MIDPEITVDLPLLPTDFELDHIELGSRVMLDVFFENHRPSGVCSGGLPDICGAGAIRERVDHAAWLLRRGYR